MLSEYWATRNSCYPTYTYREVFCPLSENKILNREVHVTKLEVAKKYVLVNLLIRPAWFEQATPR